MSDKKIRVPPSSRKACSENNLQDFSSLRTRGEPEQDECQDNDMLIDQLAKRIELNNNYLQQFKGLVKDGEYFKQKMDEKLKEEEIALAKQQAAAQKAGQQEEEGLEENPEQNLHESNQETSLMRGHTQYAATKSVVKKPPSQKVSTKTVNSISKNEQIIEVDDEDDSKSSVSLGTDDDLSDASSKKKFKTPFVDVQSMDKDEPQGDPSEKQKIINNSKHMTQKHLIKKLTGGTGMKKLGTSKYQKADTIVDNTVIEEEERSDDESMLTDQLSVAPAEKDKAKGSSKLAQKTFVTVNSPARQGTMFSNQPAVDNPGQISFFNRSPTTKMGNEFKMSRITKIGGKGGSREPSRLGNDSSCAFISPIASARSSRMQINESRLGNSNLGRGLTQSGLQADEVEAYVNQKLKKQEKFLEKVHRTEMKKRETLQWQVMIEWLDEKLKEISKMLTRNHQGLVRQLMAYKSKTDQKLRDLKLYQERMHQAEAAQVHTNSVLEAEYGMDPKSPFNLYDCLVPVIQESVERQTMTYAQKMVFDRKKQLQRESRAECKLRILEGDVRVLEAANNQRIKEMELVRWYIEVMEQGVDATKAMKDYAILKKNFHALEKQKKEDQMNYESEINILNHKLKETKDQLKKQHFEVTKPLIEEVKLQTEINTRSKKEIERNKLDLQKLCFMLRIPRMTDSFQKAVRRYKNAEEQKRYEREAIQHMSKFIDFTNEEKFYDGMVEHIEKAYMNPHAEARPPEQNQARGIVPETNRQSPNTPMKDIKRQKPSQNGRSIDQEERKRVQMLALQLQKPNHDVLSSNTSESASIKMPYSTKFGNQIQSITADKIRSVMSPKQSTKVVHRKIFCVDEKSETLEMKKEQLFLSDVRQKEIRSPLMSKQNSKTVLSDLHNVTADSSELQHTGKKVVEVKILENDSDEPQSRNEPLTLDQSSSPIRKSPPQIKRVSPKKKQSCKEVRNRGKFSELTQIVKKHPEVRQSLQNVAIHAMNFKSPMTPKATERAPLTPKTSEKTLYFNNKAIRVLKANDKGTLVSDRRSCFSQSPRKEGSGGIDHAGSGISQIQSIIKAENKRLSSQKVSYLQKKGMNWKHL